MTTKSDYTEEEWAALRRAPLVAGMAISLADPGGAIELTKETLASIRAMTNPGSDAELLVAVSQDAMAMAQQHHNPIGDFKPKGATAGQEILDEVRRVNTILTAKATPEEAEAFRAWMLAAAQGAADAAKEGGFLGFHAVRVSEGEQKMLDQLRAALGAGASWDAAVLNAEDLAERAGVEPDYMTRLVELAILVADGDGFSGGDVRNLASRIAWYARPGEVLVSRDVVDASDLSGVTFAEIGQVDLKGVAGGVELHVARRAGWRASSLQRRRRRG